MKSIRKVLSLALALALLASMSASGIWNLDATAATQGTWKLVTDWSELKAGNQIILVYNGNAMGGKVSGNNYFSLAEDITISGDEVTNLGSASILTLEAGSEAGYFRLKLGEKHIYYGNDSTSTKLNAFDESVTSTDIPLYDWAFNSEANEISNHGASDRFLQFSTDRVASYKKSSSYHSPQIYMLLTDVIDRTGEYINLSGHSACFDTMLYLRYYFTLGTKAASAEIAEYGIEYWNSQPGEDAANPDRPCDGKKTGYGVDTTNNLTYFSIGGLAPNHILDTQYYRAYIIIGGVKYCTEVQSYSLEQYKADAAALIASDPKLGTLIDAAIAYGKAANAYYPAEN